MKIRNGNIKDVEKLKEIRNCITILIAAILRTSLSEEIFFRVFLAKRLIALTNFQTGNFLQELIFGIIHTLFFLPITHNALFFLVIFIFPAMSAYLQTYLTHKI